jgi:hypothetical protein
MLIGAISSNASTTRVLNPVLTARSTATSSLASATSSKESPSTASSSTFLSSTVSPAKTSHSGSSSGGGGGSAAVQEMDQATSYSTTVAGKQYSGSVDESDGEYTASISNLSGASATGSSIQAAENSLDTRINEIV